MSSVFVLDSHKHLCDLVHPGQARRLLSAGKAVIFRSCPFVIFLKEERSAEAHLLRVKCDPGAQKTGIAIVDDRQSQVVWAAELSHHGFAITEKLLKRRAQRQGRRHRHTHYRQARYQNRRRTKGWVGPSLKSRVENMLTGLRAYNAGVPSPRSPSRWSSSIPRLWSIQKLTILRINKAHYLAMN